MPLFMPVYSRGSFLLHAAISPRLFQDHFQSIEAVRVPHRSESKSKDRRYLDIHEDDQLDETQLAVWVKQASLLPGRRM